MSRPILFALLATLAAAPASAQFKPNASGDFRIAGSVAAPWADAARGAPSDESRRLEGQSITFRAREIAGPSPFGCKPARYETKSYDPDMLFQGGLTDPAKQAEALGFAPGKIQTVETGCAIDFHFADADHAMVALNNRIYRLERVAPKDKAAR